MRIIIEEKLREIMGDYNIKMILFVHPDLGTVQLTKKQTWYIQGRKYHSDILVKEAKFWCTKCDIKLENKGIALDCPEDGTFYECPKCNCRIVIIKKGT